MDKITYETPKIIITEFEYEDVITTSGGGIVLPPDEFSLGLGENNEYWY